MVSRRAITALPGALCVAFLAGDAADTDQSKTVGVVFELIGAGSRGAGRPPLPGVFPDYHAPVISNAGSERERVMMRWAMPPPRTGGPNFEAVA